MSDAPRRARQTAASRTVSAFASGRPWWHFLIDAAVLTVLLGVGVLGFGPAYGHDPKYLIAGFGAIVLGLGVAALGAHWRLGVLTMMAVSFAVYMLFGTPLAASGDAIAGFIPTGESLRGLLLGIMLSWKHMLTLAAPLGTSVEVMVVPYLATFIASVVAGSLAWRLRSAYWSLLPVVALFIAGILFGTAQVFLPGARGVVLAVVSIVWLSYRFGLDRRESAQAVSANQSIADPAAARIAFLRRLGMGVGVVAVAGALTLVATPAMTSPGAREVLRENVVPPPELHELPSPLTKFRDYLKNEKETVLFTVDGLPKDGRIRIAAMDSYDGVVFNVDPNSSASFAPIGDPKSLNQSMGDGAAAVGIKIAGYNGVWIPNVAVAQSLAYQSSSGETPTLYLNKESGTALNFAGIIQGDSYSMNVDVPVVDPDRLAKANFGTMRLPKPDNVPQVVGVKANNIVGETSNPLEQVRALEMALREQGKFSNGLEGQVQSSSGHSAARITKMLSDEQMIGDDEQYATAMVLMARHLGIPARVVMGFYPDPKGKANGAKSFKVTGADVHAWVEVNFAGVGWVPFNPTPDKDNVPNPPEPQKASKPKPQVLQPPPPPPEPVDLPDDSDSDTIDPTPGPKQMPEIVSAILTILAVVGIPVVILILPLVLIVALKSRRRKKRLTQGLPTDRVGGGWSEVLSQATDLGAVVDLSGTRRETAASLETSFPGTQGTTALLAQRADAAIFGPGQPTESEVAGYWDNVEQSLKSMNGSVGFWKRMRARFSPRSLLVESRKRSGRTAK